jgi:hypothetical protein
VDFGLCPLFAKIHGMQRLQAAFPHILCMVGGGKQRRGRGSLVEGILCYKTW